jgi:formate dehydrogenase major subunit
MPADQIEIVEADEEGVIFKNLTNPIEILSDAEGRVKSMRLQIMELGEPDASGRRSPKPVAGKEETIEVDTVILAIGQAVDPAGFKGLTLTKKKGIVADTETFLTNIEGVFAGGDCANDKISIAVEAIADAKKASGVIDAYLNGEKVYFRHPYGVIRTDITEKTFEDRERQCRPKMEHLSPEERKGNFTEVVFGYDEMQAMAEASRCLECGCHDYFECKLVQFANEYEVKPARLKGDVNQTEMPDNHPFIIRDPNKCVLCGLCVRVCDEVMGIGALGLVNRGFDTVVKPTLELPLAESGCISCGQCVSVCPVGALQERPNLVKPVPLATECVSTTCGYCSVGCGLVLETHGNMLVKSVPDMEGAVNQGLLCGRGRFGYDFVIGEERLQEPLIKKNGQFEEVDYHEAFVFAAKKAQSLGARHGKDSVAVAISDRYTNEEAYVIKKFAESIGAKTLCFNNRPSGLARVLGADASPNTFDEMLSTEVLLVAGFSMKENPVAGLKVRQAAQRGVKVAVISPEGIEDDRVEDYASVTASVSDDVDFLKQVAKALIEMGKKPANAGGFNTLKDSLDGIKVSPEAKAMAEFYGNAKKAMILFAQNQVSVEAAELIADIAVISGHIGQPRNGIVQIKAKNNSQGLVDLGVSAGPEAMAGVKAVLIFGEDPVGFDFQGVEFMMVCDTHLTATADQADVVIPGTAFISTDGTFTSTERRLNQVEAAVDEGLLFENWEVAAELAHVFEVEMPFDDVEDIANEMAAALPYYRDTEIGEIYGGVLYRNGFAFKDGKAKLAAVGGAKFVAPVRNTDYLMKMIDDKLPKPAAI